MGRVKVYEPLVMAIPLHVWKDKLSNTRRRAILHRQTLFTVWSVTHWFTSLNFHTVITNPLRCLDSLAIKWAQAQITFFIRVVGEINQTTAQSWSQSKVGQTITGSHNCEFFLSICEIMCLTPLAKHWPSLIHYHAWVLLQKTEQKHETTLNIVNLRNRWFASRLTGFSLTINIQPQLLNSTHNASISMFYMKTFFEDSTCSK